MTTLSPTELAKLSRFLLAHQDRFALALVRIPNFHQRKEFASWVQGFAKDKDEDKTKPRPVLLFDFTGKTPIQVWSEIERGLPTGGIAVLDGLDLALNDSHTELASLLNRQRERIAQLLPGPVLLVLGDSAMNRFLADAPDLADWHAARFEFEREAIANISRESQDSSKIPELSSELIDSRIALLTQQLVSPLPDHSRARILLEIAQLHRDSVYSVRTDADHPRLRTAQDSIQAAETALREAVNLLQRPSNKAFQSTLSSALDRLARLLKDQGRYADAEPLLRRALEVTAKVLGPEHPDTLTSLNNLALLYDNQGRYAEAEPPYLRALQTREKILGPEHPNTLASLNNLAALYDSQGRYAEAEHMYSTALAAREKTLGPEHPDTLQSLNNLALLYDHQGRYAEAEPMYSTALATKEKVLGPEHPSTLTSLNNLAMLYENQKRYAEAETLYSRLMLGLERVLGSTHPNTIVGANNYARLLRKLNRNDEARDLEARFPRPSKPRSA